MEELQAAGDILQATTDALLAKLANAIDTVEGASPRDSVEKTISQITKVTGAISARARIKQHQPC